MYKILALYFLRGLFRNQGFLPTQNRHPGFFPPGITCTWKITAPKGQHIRLQITPLTMPISCETASIFVHEGSDVTGKLVKRICSSLDPPVLFSTGSQFWVQFRVAPGSKQYYRGFNATYEIIRSSKLATILLHNSLLSLLY